MKVTTFSYLILLQSYLIVSTDDQIIKYDNILFAICILLR